jgi:hypothetical protein
MSRAALYASSSKGFIPTPIVQRPPLTGWPPGSYQSILPWDPPNTRDYLRANAWAVEIEGLPWVPGAAMEQPQRMLTWFQDRYPMEYQIKGLKKHASYGYTHFIRSAPDSMQGNGLSLNQLVDSCGLTKQYIKYVHMFIGAKPQAWGGQPQDMSTQQWLDYAFPIMEALMNAKVVDEFTPGWEWNLWNIAGGTESPSIQVPQSIAQYALTKGISTWMHFSPHVTYWGADGTDCPDRYSYWQNLPDVRGIMYQGDSSWDIGELQARMVDTLKQFGQQGNVHLFRMYEDIAWIQYMNNPPSEADGNLRGYCACCATDVVGGTDAKDWGYGNGGQLPNGDVL